MKQSPESPSPGTGDQTDLTIHSFHKTLYDREADTGSAGLCGKIGVKQFSLVLIRDSLAPV